MSEHNNLDTSSAGRQEAAMHHPFGPSVLERRSRCPMSYHAEKDLPDITSEDGLAGTELHNQMQALIAGMTNERGALECPGDSLPIGSYPQAVETMLLRLMDIYTDHDMVSWPDYPIHTEVRLTLPEVTGSDDAIYGTADCVIVRPDSVVVIDWKTGRGETVEAANNMQTAAYCVAAAKRFGRASAVAHVVNPNFRQEAGFHLTPEMLGNALAQIIGIKSVGEECDRNPDPAKYVPGEIQCAWCKASTQGTCPVVQNVFQQLVLHANLPDIASAVSLMHDDDLSDLLDKSSLVRKMLKTIDDEAKRRCNASASKSFGRYFLKETSGGKEIKDLRSCYSAISDLLTIDEFMEICSISVPSLRDFIAERLQLQGDVRTKKAGRERFDLLLLDFLSDKQPRQSLTRIKD